MSNKFILIVICGLLGSCQLIPRVGQKEVTLYKQWHLSPQHNVLDIQKAKKLPHYQNQTLIYKDLKNKIQNKQLDAIFIEGCQGRISKEYKTKFNGWNIAHLKEYKDKKEFEEILAPIGMKLHVEFPKFPIICSDNYEDIEKNLIALSNIRAYSSFYFRLKELKQKDKEKYNAYAAELEKIAKTKLKDPINYANNMAKESIKEFYHYIHKRNESFAQSIRRSSYKSSAVIIGGLHAEDLAAKLKPAEVKIIAIKGYQSNEEELLKMIQKSLQTTKLILFQLPAGFDIDKFPTQKKIKTTIMTEDEEKILASLLLQFQIPSKLLVSDYDQDGIRDFTFSTQGEDLVMAAEDDDWDNDGIPNLIDESIGSLSLRTSPKNLIKNDLRALSTEAEIKSYFDQQDIQLLGVHELLILTIFKRMQEKLQLDASRIKFIIASTNNDAFQSSNTFFSYNSQNQSLIYFPEHLKKFFLLEYQKHFSDLVMGEFLNEYAIPVIVHSLGHEFYHSYQSANLNTKIIESMVSQKEKEVESLYLTKGRLSRKVIHKEIIQFKVRNKTFQQWMVEFKKHGDDKDTPFIIKHDLPSMYALKSKEEFAAEVYSICLFNQVYPQAHKKERSHYYASSLGINPLFKFEQLECRQ
ncbi:MAG: hypothetical protein CME62_11330 [Halobacteriovoraceae bacterium]|nr:hypothetical protein [Halobacteriovoraceae bacterium]|tara:strand:- start:37490 stop:39397 length:1908 start_codon:yes stop_codon:yes gene_type:complete